MFRLKRHLLGLVDYGNNQLQPYSHRMSPPALPLADQLTDQILTAAECFATTPHQQPSTGGYQT